MIFSKTKKDDKASRYVDPTGEFTSKELKLATWYIKNKFLLQKIGTGFLIAWCVLTIGYSLFAWGNYLIFGYFDDEEMLMRQTLELSDYASLHSLYGARDLVLGSAMIYQSSIDKFDFATMVKNSNERWVAQISYKYIYSGGETEKIKTILLPQTERPVVAFGQKVDGYPTNARLVIENVEWRSVDAHAVANVGEHIDQRLQFYADNFVFTRAGGAMGLPSNRIEFDLYNDSAYSYWEPQFYIELLDDAYPVGILFLTVDQFISGEARAIDLRTLAENLTVDDVRIIPVINVFDSGEYIEPGR